MRSTAIPYTPERIRKATAFATILTIAYAPDVILVKGLVSPEVEAFSKIVYSAQKAQD